MGPFEYREPRTLKEAYEELSRYGSEGKLIAGGTALVIMMKQRLVRPRCLISLRRVRGLSGIAPKDGGVRIGALTTHREVETSPLIRHRLSLLADTYRRVATIRVRNMATVGGGLAHGDPNQDPPPSLLVLGAKVKAGSRAGTREIPLEEFFKDYYETALGPEEMVTEVFVPWPSRRSGWAFLKFLPRTADDYATVSAAALVELADGGKKFADVRLALGSVGVTPVRARAAEAALREQPLRPEGIREAAEKVKDEVDPISDLRGSAAYKKEMAAVFARRALEEAVRMARGAMRASSAKAKGGKRR